jgi:hypothetical protein
MSMQLNEPWEKVCDGWWVDLSKEEKIDIYEEGSNLPKSCGYKEIKTGGDGDDRVCPGCCQEVKDFVMQRRPGLCRC